MFLQSETINNEIQVVLFNDLEEHVAIMPYIVDEDGEKKLVIPQSVEDYIEGQLSGEAKGYEDDVLRDVKRLLDKHYFMRTPVQELHKRYFRKNIPDPPKPQPPQRPTKMKRPLEPMEIKPPVLPKDMIEKVMGAKR